MARRKTVKKLADQFVAWNVEVNVRFRNLGKVTKCCRRLGLDPRPHDENNGVFSIRVFIPAYPDKEEYKTLKIFKREMRALGIRTVKILPLAILTCPAGILS